MATSNPPRPKTAQRDGIFRFTVEQFARLEGLGYFEDRRVELIEGIIHEMTIKPAHALASELMYPALWPIFGEVWRIRLALPLAVGRRSLPEPDVAVVAGHTRELGLAHPTTAALIIEISDATLQKDRTIKAHLYAQAGVADYWILNLVDRQVEVHRGPGPDPSRPGRFRYAEVTTVPATGNMAPLAAPGSPIAVATLLP